MDDQGRTVIHSIEQKGKQWMLLFLREFKNTDRVSYLEAEFF